MSGLYKEVGRRVKDERVGLNMSQGDFATLVGLSRPSIANIESGNQGVSLHVLYNMAKALRVLPHHLLPLPGQVGKDGLDSIPTLTDEERQSIRNAVKIIDSYPS